IPRRPDPGHVAPPRADHRRVHGAGRQATGDRPLEPGIGGARGGHPPRPRARRSRGGEMISTAPPVQPAAVSPGPATRPAGRSRLLGRTRKFLTALAYVVGALALGVI